MYGQLSGVRGNHFPGQSFVMFAGEPLPHKDELTRRLQEAVNDKIKHPIAITVDNETTPRQVCIEGVRTYPCGGTHLNSTGQFEELTVRSVRVVKKELRVGYDVK
jgi:Ser-tRNA(Ala) deacylase AlaX